MRNIFNVFVGLLLLLGGAGNITAQTTQASFTGKVTNSAGALLQGATVQIKNQSTGFNSSTVTNANGNYVFKELPLGGPYFVLVSYTGYKEFKKDGIRLTREMWLP
ncbi:carboxypeptidase-like regulatory domain-containing protein [Niabella sp. W65]|nr:carboxypeptidase-like regulatory domain-containing protein [Niabella sp. W65]MCH7361568.1 carboxypeptidase-like regulatory domain-containing protein [Niabella sp. W65]